MFGTDDFLLGADTEAHPYQDLFDPILAKRTSAYEQTNDGLNWIVAGPDTTVPEPTSRKVQLVGSLAWPYEHFPTAQNPNVWAARRRVVDMTVRLNMRRSLIMEATL